MAEKELIETSEAQIAVHWQEEDYFYASPWFVAQANMKDERIFERFQPGQLSQLL
jgi:acetyl-CoA synthetase